ncbi:MAG: VanZ family protein [Acidobacteriota bacterium]
MTVNSFMRYQFPVLFWMGLIFFLSSRSFSHLPPLLPGTDKVVHMIIYAVLCGLMHRALRFQPLDRIASFSLFIALALTPLYGISDELHQLFVPGRSCDVMDLLADLTGGCIYVVTYLKLKFYEPA